MPPEKTDEIPSPLVHITGEDQAGHPQSPSTNLLPPLCDSDDEEFPFGGSICSDVISNSTSPGQFSNARPAPQSVLRRGKYSTYQPSESSQAETPSTASIYSAPPPQQSGDDSLMFEEDDELTELVSIGSYGSASQMSNSYMARKRHRRNGHRRPFVANGQQGLYYSPSRSTDFVPPTPTVIGNFVPTRVKNIKDFLSPKKKSPLRVYPLENQVIPGGPILTRCSMRSLIFKTWHESYWARYGPSKILIFRCRRDFTEWMKINSAAKNLDPASSSSTNTELTGQDEDNIESGAIVKSRKRRGIRRSRTRRKEGDLVRKVIDFDTVGVLEKAEREFAEKEARKQEKKHGGSVLSDGQSVMSSGTTASKSAMRHALGLRVFRYGLLQMKFKKYPLSDAGRSYRVRLATLYNFKLVHWTDAGHGIAVAFGSRQLHELHSLRNSIIDCMDYCAKEKKARRKKSKKKHKKSSKSKSKGKSSASSLPPNLGQGRFNMNLSYTVGPSSLHCVSGDGDSSVSSYGSSSLASAPNEVVSLPPGTLSEHQLKLPQYQDVGSLYQAGIYQYTRVGVPRAPESVASGISTISNVSSNRVGFDGVRKK